jgi:putative redox protein
MGNGEVDGEFELNVKRGEAGKLSTHVTAKIKIEELTAEQKGINKPMLVMFTA